MPAWRSWAVDRVSPSYEPAPSPHKFSVRGSSSGAVSGSSLRSRTSHTITDTVTAAATTPAMSHAVLETRPVDRSFRSARLKASRASILVAALFNLIISAFPDSGVFGQPTGPLKIPKKYRDAIPQGHFHRDPH